MMVMIMYLDIIMFILLVVISLLKELIKILLTRRKGNKTIVAWFCLGCLGCLNFLGFLG